MKDQYICDIGDYGKYGLLRELERNGFRIGVNWYYTADDVTEYLNGSGFPDKELQQVLNHIAKEHTNRRISHIEQSNLFNNALFFNNPLVTGSDKRAEWHKNALATLKECDFVYLDPDTGLENATINFNKSDSMKFVTYAEAADYFKRGQNVIIYQHDKRVNEKVYTELFGKFSDDYKIPREQISYLRFASKTVRFYAFLLQRNKADAINNILKDFTTKWQKSFKVTMKEGC